MSDKVLVIKADVKNNASMQEPVPEGNTQGLTGAGGGAFLNVSADRRDLGAKQPKVLQNRNQGQPILDDNGKIQYDERNNQILDRDAYVNNPNAGQNKYNKLQRYGGAALRGISALGAGIGALSRFSGSDEDALTAASSGAQDAYTTYGTTAGVERALIPRFDGTSDPSKTRLSQQFNSQVAVKPELDNKLMGQDKQMGYRGLPTAPNLANSTVDPNANAATTTTTVKPSEKHSMVVAGTAEPPNSVKVVKPEEILDNIDVGAMQRAQELRTGKKTNSTDGEDEKYGYGKNDPNINGIPGF